jgi:hypothetical protein
LRAARWAAVVGLILLLAVGPVEAVGAAKPAKEKEAAYPSYVIPNIVAVLMVAAVLAVACKRFPKT